MKIRPVIHLATQRSDFLKAYLVERCPLMGAKAWWRKSHFTFLFIKIIVRAGNKRLITNLKHSLCEHQELGNGKKYLWLDKNINLNINNF